MRVWGRDWTSSFHAVSAVAGTDYTAVPPSSLVFPTESTGTMDQCIDVTVTNDEVIEGDETFTVGLTVNTPVVMEGNTMTTVTITTSTDDS